MFRSIHAHKRISFRWVDGSFTHYYPNARWGHLNHKTPKQRKRELEDQQALADFVNAIAHRRQSDGIESERLHSIRNKERVANAQ